MSSMKETIVLNLPSDLFMEILCRWLDLKSIVHLDSAVCNYEARPELLALFSSGQCIVNSLVKFENERLVRWFLLRDVQVSRLQISRHIPELGKYLLSHSQSVRHVCYLSPEGMGVVEIYLRNLDTLECRSSKEIPDLNGILRFNSNLQELLLENVNNLSVEFFKELELQRLRFLSLWDSICDDKLLVTIVGTTKGLTGIDLGMCKLVTDTGVIKISQHCPQLCFLMLALQPISDGALDKVTKFCPCITFLDLSMNNVVTDLGVRALAENLRDLQHIIINDCENLTDASIEHLIEFNASRLMHLRADWFPTVRVDLLLSLLKNCSNLHILGLDCDFGTYYSDIIPYMCNLKTLVLRYALADDALCMIAEHCKGIQNLAIYSDCVHFIPEELAGIVDTSRVLYCAADWLDWSERKYTEKGLLALLNGLPQLKVLGVHEKEIAGGFLTPLAQSIWRDLRPNIIFVEKLEDFVALAR